MKRPILIFVAVIGLVVAMSGCSVKEVQLWFQVHKNTSVSSDQAKTIADQINAKRTPGCDPFYSADGANASTCVPDNVASVHCAGALGDGPSVMGPLKVGAYDPFNLDADGDKEACVDPVGSIDVLGQVLTNQIHLAGWAFDPNTTDPIHLTVTDNGVSSDQLANGSRPDVNAAFAGVGTTHGFDITLTPAAGATHQICVTAKNVGAGTDQLLGCKTITLQDVGEDAPTGHDVVGLIEGADVVPGGIHIRGFAFDDLTQGTLPSVSYGVAETPTVIASLTGKQIVIRPDVVTAFGQQAGVLYGFDFVMPVTPPASGAAATVPQNICLYDSVVSGTQTQLMCRPVNS